MFATFPNLYPTLRLYLLYPEDLSVTETNCEKDSFGGKSLQNACV